MVAGSGTLPPPVAPVAPATPVASPAAPRKYVELVLVQNPGDDVCFAKQDERRISQQASRP